MKKLIMILSFVILLTGCQITEIKDNNIDNIVDSVIKNKVNIANTYFEGYKYYLPRGIKLLNKTDYNAKLSYKNNLIYIYVDAVSYYHKTNVEIKLNKDSYYSKEFDYNDKKGYIEIDKLKDSYFVGMYYNYAKVETYVKEEDLNDTIIQVGCILSSIKFNDSVLESIVGENILDYKEENFNLFDTKKNSNFLEYVEEFDTYDDTKVESDEDTIETDLYE